MATQFPEPIPVPLIDPVATQINQSIDRLILSLERRRVQLLTELRDRREEMRAKQVASQQIELQIAETRALLEGQLMHNKLYSMQDRLVAELEATRAEIQANAPPPQDLKFLCDTRDLEGHISRLGDIVQLDIPPAVPDYAAFLQPSVAVGKEGSAPGELNGPRGVAIEQASGHIYVADRSNSRIQIFSETGECLNQFGDQHLKEPWGILTYQDSIFVTDMRLHAIFRFKLSDLTMIKQVGKYGSGKKEFKHPRQLAISPNQLLYVPDQSNNRIQILSTDLVFQGSLRHPIMTSPEDVKFTNNEMFVLSFVDNPCIHVFTLSGEKSRSLVTREGIGMQVTGAYFFCLDRLNNIVISDCSAHAIKVFSPARNLLHKIGQRRHQAGMFNCPYGIAILNNTKLVCVSENKNFGLQIFTP